MLLDILFLQGTPASGSEGAAQGSPWQFPIMMGLVIVVFYFFMIRPNQKRQKEESSFRNALQKGDKVMTVGGVYGKVVGLEDDLTAIVEVDTNVKVRILREALRPIPDEPKKS